MPQLRSETVNLTEAVTVRMDPETLHALDAIRGENGRGAQIRLLLQASLEISPVKPRKLRRFMAGARSRARGELAGLVTELGRATGAFVMAAKALRLSRQRPDLHAEVEKLIVEFRKLQRQMDDVMRREDGP